MAANDLLPAEKVRQLVDYDPSTGKFTIRARRPDDFKVASNRSAEHTCAAWNSRRAGKPAGITKHAHGYLGMRLLGRHYFAHRVAWAHVHGEWPQGEIDHVNGNRDDNRIANLRDVGRITNMRNRRVWLPSKSGHRGIALRGRRWCVTICKKGVGTYDTLAEAIQARTAAERALGFTPL